MLDRDSRVTFTSVRFRQFKGLGNYALPLRHMNVLVGPNNSGKSTVIGAFRVLAAGLRRANAKRPEWLQVGNTARLAYQIPDDAISISTENIHTNYADVETSVTFDLSNGNRLNLVFPVGGDCFLVPDASGHALTGTTSFWTQFPVNVGVVPVLGPVEQEEELVLEKTIRDGLASYSRRASRHFRSYWYYHRTEFEPFRERIRSTWPTLDIERPEIADPPYGKRLAMFVDEARVPKELYWAGFGFQVWCQLLTHAMREANATILIVDEPEIYLHPELQRQLVSILREAGPDVLLATHSSEIVGEAEPHDLVIVEKSHTTAQRVIATEGVQRALGVLGSVHNTVLSQLARTGRVLFVEGEDFKILGRFARRLGYPFLAAEIDFAVQMTDGFPSADALRGFTKGMAEAVAKPLAFAGVFDRDYRPASEVRSFQAEVKAHVPLCHVLDRKEIENYLLVPAVLERAIARAAKDKAARGGNMPARLPSAQEMLLRLAETHRLDVQGQLVAAAIRESRGSGTDHSVTTKEVTRDFEKEWASFEGRMRIAPGKMVFRAVVAELQGSLGINLTARAVVDAYRADEVPSEIRTLLADLERFRTSRSAKR